MRAAMPLALLLLLLALPAALAQDGREASLAFPSDHDGRLPPGTPVEVPFYVNATCGATPVHARYHVVKAPAWLVTTLTPAGDETGGCGRDGRVAFEGLARLLATAEAPAFQPEALELEALVVWGDDVSTSARSTFLIMPRFAPALDVSTPSVDLPARPGQRVLFPVDVRNPGNGATRVHFTLEVEDNRLQARVEPSIVLESRQAGGTKTSEQVLVEATLPQGVNEPQALTLRWRSHYALDPKLPGNEGSMLLRLVPVAPPTPTATPAPTFPSAPTRDEGPSDEARGLPGPALAPTLAALAAAALAASWRRRHQP